MGNNHCEANCSTSPKQASAPPNLVHDVGLQLLTSEPSRKRESKVQPHHERTFRSEVDQLFRHGRCGSTLPDVDELAVLYFRDPDLALRVAGGIALRIV